jgi:hypothetical protein
MQTFLLSVLPLRFAFQYFHEPIDVFTVANRFSGGNLIILIGSNRTHHRQDGSWGFWFELVRGRRDYGLGSSCILFGRSYWFAIMRVGSWLFVFENINLWNDFMRTWSWPTVYPIPFLLHYVLYLLIKSKKMQLLFHTPFRPTFNSLNLRFSHRIPATFKSRTPPPNR